MYCNYFYFEHNISSVRTIIAMSTQDSERLIVWLWRCVCMFALRLLMLICCLMLAHNQRSQIQRQINKKQKAINPILSSRRNLDCKIYIQKCRIHTHTVIVVAVDTFISTTKLHSSNLISFAFLFVHTHFVFFMFIAHILPASEMMMTMMTTNFGLIQH